MATNKKLSAVITIGGAVASTLKSAIGSTTSQLDGLGKTIRQLTRRQNELGSAMREGFSGTSFRLRAMRDEYAQATAQIERQRAAVRRLAAAQERSAKLVARGRKVAAIGIGMSVVGAGMMAPAVLSTRQASSYATERARINALGLGPETAKHAESFARAMKTVGTSKLENLTLVRDALSVFGDLHHAELAAPVLADMKFGNAAVFGAEHGQDNEAKFMDMLKVIELRGGTKSQDAFRAQANMVQKVISATGGRVGPEEWRHLIATGGLAAKGMRDDAFYYQLEPLVQEMGGDRVGTGIMSAYSSLYQGHITKRAANNLAKFGLIADPSKVKHDKTGQISFMDPGALKGADLFRQSQYEWLKKVLLPTLAAKGMTSKDQVLDAIGAIVSNRKGADVLGAMYLQQLQIDKSERMNRGAADVDQLKAGGMNTPEGRRLQLHKQMADAELQFGEKVLPIYTKALTLAGDALERLNAFSERHPTLAKVMAVGVTAVGATLAALSPVVGLASGLLTAYAALQLRAAAAAATAATSIGAETAAMEAQAAVGGGLMGLAGKAGLVAMAGAAGYGVGTLAYKGLLEGNSAGNALGRGIAATLGFFGNKEARQSIRQEAMLGSDNLPDVRGVAPRAGTTVQDNSQHTYHFQLPPNTDVQALADEIERRTQRKAGVRSRSIMFDGVGAQ